VNTFEHFFTDIRVTRLVEFLPLGDYLLWVAFLIIAPKVTHLTTFSADEIIHQFIEKQEQAFALWLSEA
jgi:hypothetical protein